MKLKKQALKAWSTWGIGLIALVEGVRQSWPLLQNQMPESVYDYGLFALAGAVLVLRFIDQGLDDA